MRRVENQSLLHQLYRTCNGDLPDIFKKKKMQGKYNDFKTTTEYFPHLPFFICTFHRCLLPAAEEICGICLNFTALAQFLGVYPRANGR